MNNLTSEARLQRAPGRRQAGREMARICHSAGRWPRCFGRLTGAIAHGDAAEARRSPLFRWQHIKIYQFHRCRSRARVWVPPPPMGSGPARRRRPLCGWLSLPFPFPFVHTNCSLCKVAARSLTRAPAEDKAASCDTRNPIDWWPLSQSSAMTLSLRLSHRRQSRPVASAT